MISKEEIEIIDNFYKQKIEYTQEVDKEDLMLDIVSVYTIMSNFEDNICEIMQHRVARIKKYIEQLEQQNNKQIKNIEPFREYTLSQLGLEEK